MANCRWIARTDSSAEHWSIPLRLPTFCTLSACPSLTSSSSSSSMRRTEEEEGWPDEDDAVSAAQPSSGVAFVGDSSFENCLMISSTDSSAVAGLFPSNDGRELDSAGVSHDEASVAWERVEGAESEGSCGAGVAGKMPRLSITA